MEMKVRLTLLEPMLGTIPGDKELVCNYISNKHPEKKSDEEINTVPEELEKMSTGFHRDENKIPFIYNYMIKGFLKEAASSLIRGKQLELKAHKKIVDQVVFIKPRRIYFTGNIKLPLQYLERPLRAQTAQGERVALARSEMIPEGTKIDFTIMCMDDKLENLIGSLLDYGKYRGLGQWRNADYGSFTWEEVE